MNTQALELPRRSRLGVISAVVIAGVAAAYAASPLVSAALLVRAAAAGDTQAVAAAVSFPAVRKSVARQIVADQVRERNLTGLERQAALGPGMLTVAAWLEDYLTADNLAAALTGRPMRLPGANAAQDMTLPTLTAANAGSVFGLWWRSGFTGPVSYELRPPTPPEASQAAGDAGSLGLEFDGARWRVTSIALPQKLRTELAAKVRDLSATPQARPGG